ncbi:MAG: biotin/lipoyl-binding protein, partial [Candidatus Brocadiae bacterium]|nr:biotin/lipoyl-binding protein [Candidatus Brocadiia bacterium]
MKHGKGASWLLTAACLFAGLPALPGQGAAWAASSAEAESSEVVAVTAFTMPFRQLDVASEIGGVLTAVHVEEGDQVEQDQVLAEFNADILRAKLAVSEGRIKAAEVQIEAQQASYEVLTTEFERMAQLYEETA